MKKNNKDMLVKYMAVRDKNKKYLGKHNIKVEDENINMEDLVKIVYENIY